jgi:hypothetical protein
MVTDEVVRRLYAWQQGKPVPRGETIHFPIAEADDLLIVSFVRMGGESAPWGIAYGHLGRRPKVLTVPEARNRDLVADMVAEFAPVLLEHFLHPDYSDVEVAGPRDPRPLRQLWVPNRTHLEMLHYLAYSYTFTKWGARARAKTLNALGRLSGWLFRESQRPGQVSVMVATDALRESYVFPAELVRQAHLGFLLAWLEGKGRRERRLEAAQAEERKSIATSLDPALERDLLDPAVERWGEAHKAEKSRAERAAAGVVHGVLGPELTRRFDLVERAITSLARDARDFNKGVEKLEAAAREEHWYQYLRIELAVDDEADGPAPRPTVTPRLPRPGTTSTRRRRSSASRR